MLDVVAENAARLCEANDALIHRIDGDVLQRVALFGPMPSLRMRLVIMSQSIAGSIFLVEP